MKELLNYRDEVREALALGMPVVALETTVIAQGLPYPLNLETALSLEEIVRNAGSIPAHICLKDGKISIGLSREEISLLAIHNKEVSKLSTKDLSYALSQKLLGATTVAATMFCANLAGIRIFATGGIGGVHRGAHLTFDISPDLIELSRTNVAVICAGAKSILDIKRTLEMLETLRVPVIGFGTQSFPAFYSQQSGCKLDLSVNTVESMSHLLRTHFRMANTGIVIANPIAKEEALCRDEVENWITVALDKALTEGITGQKITPFLLAELLTLSKGRTLLANIALLKNNAILASKIAHQLSNL